MWKFLVRVLVAVFALTTFMLPAEAKQHVIYFYGDGCHFCEQIKPWVDELEKKYDVRVDKYEIFHDRNNANAFHEMLRAHGVKPEEAGTPTMIVNGQVLIGANVIQERFEEVLGEKPVEKKEEPMPELKNKVEAMYFYGDGCHFCEKIRPWVEEIEKKHAGWLTLHKYEVFKNRENNKMFFQEMKKHGIPTEEAGTPALVINGKAFVGADSIIDNLEKEFFSAAAGPTSEEVKPIAENALTIPAIFLAAAADSINPCAMMVLIILLASLLTYHKDNVSHIAAVVASFIGAVFITYFALGLGLANIMASAQIAKEISIAVGVIAIVVGLMNLKDAFFYRAGGFAVEIPDAWKGRLAKIVSGATSPLGAFASGVVVTMFELPCTGGPYLFGLSLIAASANFFERAVYLLLYNVVFILPLVAIAILCTRGTMALETAEGLKNKYAKVFRFFTGAVMLLGGIWLIWSRI